MCKNIKERTWRSLASECKNIKECTWRSLASECKNIKECTAQVANSNRQINRMRDWATACQYKLNNLPFTSPQKFCLFNAAFNQAHALVEIKLAMVDQFVGVVGKEVIGTWNGVLCDGDAFLGVQLVDQHLHIFGVWIPDLPLHG